MEKWRLMVRLERERRGKFRNHPEAKTAWRGVPPLLFSSEWEKLARTLERWVRRESPSEPVAFIARMVQEIYLPIVMRWVEENKVLLAEWRLIGNR